VNSPNPSWPRGASARGQHFEHKVLHDVSARRLDAEFRALAVFGFGGVDRGPDLGGEPQLNQLRLWFASLGNS
jgi:hypothetical protein